MAQINLVMEQGTTFTSSIQLIDSTNNSINLASYTGVADIRRSYASVNVTASFTVSTNSTGYVILGMTANASAQIPYGRYDYDVLLTDGTGIVSKVVSGKLIVNPTVSLANVDEGDGDI